MNDSNAQQDIKAVITAWANALWDKNAKAVIGLCAPEFVSYSLAPPLVSTGRGEKGLNDWFATWTSPIEHEHRDLKIHASGDVGYSHGLSRMTGTKVDGEQVDFWYRQTFGFRKVGDTWKMHHEHSSVPFKMDGSLKAAVDLKPNSAKD